MKKTKKHEKDNIVQQETEFDKLLEQPENHHVQEDGSILYGCDEEPPFFSKEYFVIAKSHLLSVWQAKNPFNEHRSVNKAALRVVHPELYKFFFPFSYIGGLIAAIFTTDKEERHNAWYNFFSSSFGEIVLLCIFGLIVCGIAILWIKVIAPLFN